MGSRLSPAAEVRSTVGAMQVTPANVLHIRNALLAESQLLNKKVAMATRDAAVGKPGQDPVSQTAADNFNQKIKTLLDQCQAYVNALDEAACALERTAKSYGHTDQQIKDSFAKFQCTHPAPTGVPTSPAAPGPALLSFARSVAGPAPTQSPPAPGDLGSLFPGAHGGSS
jgi:hypothetical protein